MDIYEKLLSGKELVAFRVSNQCIQSRSIGNIVIDLVYVIPDKGEWNNSIGFYDNYDHQKHAYKNLTINCQMDAYNAMPYGWELVIDQSYDNSKIKLEDAEKMVKTLRPLNRKLTKLDEKIGYCDSFEEFVNRLTKILGVKAFYSKPGENIQYKRNDNAGELGEYLNSLIKENQVTLGFSVAA
jgi:hypothetical protein